ncbi:MAG: PDZ domain-containing protein [Deltaproteobacteria bacterium]|nr:PDZ domain-containing protein [Deltaproteobacteria bacterium]
MLEESNSSSNTPDGKPDGFSIGRLKARDGFFRLGLHTGDVIKSVDGEAVNSLDDAEHLIDRLAEGGDFSILVERSGPLKA